MANVIGDEQRAARVNRHADRASHRVAVLPHEAGQHVDRLARRSAAGERHEDHFVATGGFRFHEPCCPTNIPFAN
jgi:hypothetical protein